MLPPSQILNLLGILFEKAIFLVNIKSQYNQYNSLDIISYIIVDRNIIYSTKYNVQYHIKLRSRTVRF